MLKIGLLHLKIFMKSHFYFFKITELAGKKKDNLMGQGYHYRVDSPD